MTIFYEPTLSFEAVISEAAGTISRDKIVMSSGSGVVKACTVLGKITASGKYVPSSVGASDGSQNAVAVSLVEVDATASDVNTSALTRTCEVVAGMLRYDASVNTQPLIAAKIASLAMVGIMAR